MKRSRDEHQADGLARMSRGSQCALPVNEYPQNPLPVVTTDVSPRLTIASRFWSVMQRVDFAPLLQPPEYANSHALLASDHESSEEDEDIGNGGTGWLIRPGLIDAICEVLITESAPGLSLDKHALFVLHTAAEALLTDLLSRAQLYTIHNGHRTVDAPALQHEVHQCFLRGEICPYTCTFHRWEAQESTMSLFKQVIWPRHVPKELLQIIESYYIDVTRDKTSNEVCHEMIAECVRTAGDGTVHSAESNIQ